MASYDASPQDEGYSEAPLTVGTMPGSADMHSWIASLPVAKRTEYVMSIIDQLPTAEVCEIIRRLRPRLYINFFQYLPTEVCLKILGFLDPISLINTARTSREWMLLALDRQSWEKLYYLEGFRVIRSEVEMFEKELNAHINIDRSRSGASEQGEGEPSSKRRATPQRILPTLHGDVDSEMLDADTPIVRQESLFGSQPRRKMPKESRDADEDMVDLPRFSARSPKPSQSPAQLVSTQLPLQDQYQTNQSLSDASSRYSTPISNMSSLVISDRSNNKRRLNWQYLYSQRRRLEANWEAEKYTNFQLPHPAHPEEAHAECIYTIQHSGKYLVSGSRDRTLRIWDLDTCRLVRKPLIAHTGSVLCLQFDADPEEDLIVSGSSDATVVLWKFSTGQIIQRLRKAHRESVLNVRFDKRVLITCSKDKSIKIFNRRPLHAGELGYPVDPVPTYLNNYGFNPAPSAGLPIKPAYSMIGCLEGHGAAVNAVQILGDELVSASGDRTIKIWNWADQTCTRTLVGHTKGIACVQYDGRRVVSGSSDNEVKIFDKETGLEVASLRAHSNLVRTVQAGFGDLPYSEEQDKEDARSIDKAFFSAVDKGEISQTAQPRGRLRNAGSRKPQDITAYGAKLPPGGGGGKFGRIVSGSYDETIIIWRRDKEGVWRAQHTLRQEEAARVAARVRRPIQIHRLNNHAQQSASQISPPTTLQQPLNSTANSGINAPTMPFAPDSAEFYHQIIDAAVSNGSVSLRQALQAHPQILTYSYLVEVINALPAASRQSMRLVVAAAIQQQQQLPGGHPGGNFAFSVPTPGGQSSPITETSAQPQATTTTGTQAPGQTPPAPESALVGPVAQAPVQTPATSAANAHVAAAQPPPPHHHHHHFPAHHHLPANMARVFKLQFDARRIICCSQTSVIVGWDFAYGDKQIIEASRFFAPIE